MSDGLFDSPESPPSHTPPHYLGFWYRVFAYLIDSWLLMLAVGVLYLMTSGWEYYVGWKYMDADNGWSYDGVVNVLKAWVFPAVVTILFWEYMLATPGKMLISARIVDATTLQAPAPSQWIVRYLGYFVSLLPLGLGFLWIAFDPRKQGWHDKLANTVVIVRSREKART